MQRSYIVLAITALFGLGIAAAYSETPAASSQQPQSAPASTDNSQTAAPSFDELDKHHRGYLLRSDIPKNVEVLKPLRMHFQDADTDQNGQLSRSEYDAYIQTQLKNNPPSGLAPNPSAPPMQGGH